MKTERFISRYMLNMQRYLHAQPKGYGGRGDLWADTVLDIMAQHGCQSLLDYGCGQGTLVKALGKRSEGLDLNEYDPAIKGKSDVPKRFFDCVVCTDVLEHIERNRLAVVIDHLHHLADKVLLLVIATRPSNKFFKDGRNVHLIIEPEQWWQPRIQHPNFEMLPPPPSPHQVPAREYVALQKRTRR